MQTSITRRFSIIFLCLLLLVAVSDLHARSLTPQQNPLPLEQMNPAALKLAVAPGAPFDINPQLIVPVADQGQIANLYALVLHGDNVWIKTPGGWKLTGEVNPFEQVGLEATMQAFAFDGSLIETAAGDRLDFYYAYEAGRQFLMGNTLRFTFTSECHSSSNIFTIQKMAELLEGMALPANPECISDSHTAIAPTLDIPALDQGQVANLHAALVAGEQLLFKTTSGWEPYLGGDLPSFATVTLGAELDGFDLPTSEIPAYDGELWYYFAYTVARNTLVGNALQVNISAMAGNLQQFLDTRIEERYIPGVVMAVDLPEEGEWVGVSGYLDWENEIPMNQDALFPIGSTTKTYLNMVMIQLLQEGVLSLDHTVKQWLPELEIPYTHLMTIRHLLTHTTGLLDYTRQPAFVDYLLNRTDELLTLEELVGFIAVEGYYDPELIGEEEAWLQGLLGEMWIYSSTNQVLLAMILEEALADTTWRSEIRRRLFEPLNLTHSFVPEPGQKITAFENYAKGYTAEADPSVPNELSHLGPAGNIVSSVSDMKHWMRAVATGDVLNAEWQAEMMRGDIPPPMEGPPYRGLAVMHDRIYNLAGHGGQAPGYTCGAQHQMDLDITLSVCFNRSVTDGNFNNYFVWPVLDMIFDLDEAQVATMKRLRETYHYLDHWDF